ncbi:MAG TPA: hypothetical protein VEH77_01440 [Roseiarcus sp.]|nr:hypothetical protein [Roseiarcus sp.]
MVSIDKSFHAGFLAIAVFGCASGSAAAADTQTAFEGIMENTAATSICATQGVGGSGAGDNHVSIYRPHILSADTPTYLSVVFTRAEWTLQNSSETSNPQMNKSGADTATIIDARGKPGTYAGTYSNFIVTPNPVTETTTVVTITGTINNYSNVAGCNVTFQAAYIKE